MTPFIGRQVELSMLHKRLERIRTTGEGVAVAIRGRRQVGKSRLVQEFCDAAGVPYLFFAATKGAAARETVNDFVAELAASTLAAAPELVPEQLPGGWPDAFRALAGQLPPTPAVVVIDELPWLAEQDDLFDGALQAAWDRLLARRPVLLLLLGSDIHMMERLTAYDRPFFGRADNLVLGPLNPAETGRALALEPAEAIDAHLISGGLPGILRSWPSAMPPLTFLEQECTDPAAPLFSVPESALLAEFPAPDRARRVLEAVGSGDRTHANIAATAGSQAGSLPSGSLSPLLQRLTEEKRVLAIDHPLGTKPTKPALYRVADSNLRLYLAAGRAAQEQARRGRPDSGIALLRRRWPAWRGKSVEPLIRESLELATSSGTLPWRNTGAVGGWWNRQFAPEVDLVGADKAPVAGRIDLVGSIKWLEGVFDRHDLDDLLRSALHVPGFTHGRTGVVVATRGGVDQEIDHDRIDVVWRPDDVIASWPDPR